MKNYYGQEYENTKKDLWVLNEISNQFRTDIDTLNSKFDAFGKNIPGENLLINGDFKVNQRGLSSYSTTQKYTVDRWVLRAVSATVQTNGIRLQCTGSGTGGFNQSIENYESLYGRTLTMSIKVRAIKGNWRIRACSANHSYNYSNNISEISLTSTGIFSKTFEFSSSSMSTYPYFNIGVYYTAEIVGDYLEIEYIKLEIGDIATKFSPKPYIEELQICQRYYRKLSGTSNNIIFGSGFAYGTTKGYILLPVAMRSSPAISYSGTLKLFVSGGYKTVSSMSVDSFSTCGVTLAITGSGYTAGQGATLSSQSDSSAYIILDSDIN